MDNQQERVEARKALEAATKDWHDNGNEIVSKQNLRMGIGGFLKDEDNHLAANAPTWLRNSLDREEQLMISVNNKKIIIAEQDKEIQKYKESITIALEALGHIENGVFGKPSSELAIEALDRINLI